MWPYWVMFAFPAVMALQEKARNPFETRDFYRRGNVRIPAGWWLLMIVLTLLIGLRHEVGGDWFNYLGNFEAAYFSYDNPAWWWNDPGYRLIEWIAIQMNWGIYAVNLMSASIFTYGLILFCRHLPRPWLALTVSVPYLVIILGMGYTRQGVALGCIMVGLVALSSNRVRKFVLWTVIAATFHKTAIVILPIAALAASRKRIFVALWVAVIIQISFNALLQDQIEGLQTNYLDTQMQSQGAFIRLAMNLIPALILLPRIKRISASLPQERLWFWISIASILMFILFFYSSSSTAVDRIALYLIPLQLVFFSYIPEILSLNQKLKYGVIALILLYYGLVEFIWLNFAIHSEKWIPYHIVVWRNV